MALIMGEFTSSLVLKGVVTFFSGNGRKLGYPTANIEVSADVPEGIFAGLTNLRGKNRPSVIFIGAPVTFGNTIKRAEAYILDQEDRDLYGEPIEITVLSKLRDNKMYDSRESLLDQMKQDEAAARQYFKEREA